MLPISVLERGMIGSNESPSTKRKNDNKLSSHMVNNSKLQLRVFTREGLRDLVGQGFVGRPCWPHDLSSIPTWSKERTEDRKLSSDLHRGTVSLPMHTLTHAVSIGIL